MSNSYRDRLQPAIGLTSPGPAGDGSGGTTFTASYIGDDPAYTKRVQRTAYPMMDGETADDLGLDSPDYSFTIYFDGPDNDRETKRFLDTMKERGPWTVAHPVLGVLQLQPLKIVPHIQPLTSGNVTAIDIDWMEPVADVPASPDAAAAVQQYADELAAEQLAFMQGAESKFGTLSERKSFSEQIRAGVAKITDSVNNVNKKFTAIQRQINSLTNQATRDIASLSGAAIQLVKTPGLMAGSLSAQVHSFGNLGRNILKELPAAAIESYNGTTSVFRTNDLNRTMACELMVSAVTIAAAQTVISTRPESRKEALTAAAGFARFVDDTQDALDGVAEYSRNNTLGDQYFTRQGTAEATAALKGAVIKYLMSLMWDLSALRIVTLDRDRSPLEVAITEYAAQSDTEADERYAFLIKSNSLSGLKVMLLNRGDRIKIYA
ncbi:hypothetical protein FACS1894110_09920 [Spirochaetia bacterium]|nr:hypothetical protein FACS1894110_09920 [Spirochaetia bacterium]